MVFYAVLMIIILIYGTICKRIKRIGNKEINRGNKIFKISIFFILWILLAFKGNFIGSDTPSYIRVFNSQIQWENNAGSLIVNLFENNTRYETGYIIFNRLVSICTNNCQWIFIIIASFFVITCYKFIDKYSENVVLSVFLLVSLRFYYLFFSGLRQAIAMMICIIAFKYIKKRNIIKFILMVLLAMQFHTSAIIFILMYPLSHFRFNTKGIVVITAIMIIVLLCFNIVLSNVLNILPDYYEHYTTSVRFDAGNLGNILMSIIILLVIVMSFFSGYNCVHKGNKDLYIKEYDENSMLSYMMLFSFWIAVISLKATTLERLYWYTWIFSIIYIPNVINTMTIKSTKKFFTVTIIVLSFIYNICLLKYRPEWNCITPYSFFWQEESYIDHYTYIRK